MPSAMESSRPVRSLKRNVFERDAPEFRAMRKSRYLKHGCGVENIGLCRCVSLLPNAPGFTTKRRVAMLYQKWYIAGVNDGTIETDSLGFLEIRRRSRAGAGMAERIAARGSAHNRPRYRQGVIRLAGRLAGVPPDGKGLEGSALVASEQARGSRFVRLSRRHVDRPYSVHQEKADDACGRIAQQRWKGVTA